MFDRLFAQLPTMEPMALDLLRQLVEIQSGSRNKPGLDRMAQAMSKVLGELMPNVRVLSFAEHGDMVQASTAPYSSGFGARRFALVGHMDTVFPEDTAFTAFGRDAERCYGPGVYDMKGGLVVGVIALTALHHMGVLDRIPVTFLCNSDEEIGSPASRPWIEEQARDWTAALVLEGGGRNRAVVTGRKGRMGFQATVQGRAGHAAKGGAKASAILELAHMIVALESLNDDPEITVNVGRIEGGIGPNTVPDQAEALVDARFLSSEGQARLEKRIAAVCAESVVSGTIRSIAPTTGRPAMPQSSANRELFTLARRQADRLGYDLPEELRFGVSDANFIAGCGVPVLDGLGPMGGMDHSDQEYILTASLMERAALVASILLDMSTMQKA
ncbi:MAG: M20 family peptidase [Desulfovibrionales bacterium]|nr:MAG: M20 family peptidase [Desulfovibrionales bacterium]